MQYNPDDYQKPSPPRTATHYFQFQFTRKQLGAWEKRQKTCHSDDEALHGKTCVSLCIPQLHKAQIQLPNRVDQINGTLWALPPAALPETLQPTAWAPKKQRQILHCCGAAQAKRKAEGLCKHSTSQAILPKPATALQIDTWAAPFLCCVVTK